MRVDITVLVGIVAGVASLVLGFFFAGGSLGALLEGTSALIVFGGTIGATTVSSSLRDIRRLPYFLKMAFTADSIDPLPLVDHFCRYVDTVRRSKSLLPLEEFANEPQNDRFLSQALKHIASNTFNADELESTVLAEHASNQRGVELFETAGGYAPTMGIAGTVMGLIHVLGSLNGGATALAASIGMAFTATLYGVGSANLFWLPISANLKTKAQQRLLIREIQMDGLFWLSKKDIGPASQLRGKLLDYVQTSLGTHVQDPHQNP
ncbi:MAG: MotA/TolQ/ExbB proton channel family protein [Thermaerobacter sp.]|nr:MotA/TolQ/ExbB proton channel family protein [Thermaerobacter sp.]